MEYKLGFDLGSALFLVAAGQGFFLSLVVASRRKENPRANLLLSLFLLAFTLMLCFNVVVWTGYNWFFPYFLILYPTLTYLFGPLLLLYIDALSDKPVLKKFQGLHFIPFVLCLIFKLPILRYSIAEIQQFIMGKGGQSYMPYWRELLHGFNLPSYFLTHCVVYTLLIFGYIYLMIPKQKVSLQINVSKLKINWLYLLAGLFLLFNLSMLTYYWLSKLPFFTVHHDYYISAVMSIGIYAIGYMGFQFPELLTKSVSHNRIIQKKYNSSTLTNSAAKSLSEKLTQYMVEEKPYRNNELKVGNLAKMLEVSPHHLSQVINEQHHKSFNQFINEYRLDEASSMLRSKAFKDTYIISIAYQVGFNNKTTFNSAFKAYTGMSPSKYRKMHFQKADANS